MSLAVVILAAGQGTRMRSALPKMLHEVAGRPLVEHVVRAARCLTPDRIILVVGHGADEVEARLGGAGLEFVTQPAQLGTGHALMQTERVLTGFAGEVMVLNGDGPLLRSETLKEMLSHHRTHGAGMTLLTCEVANPAGLGRIVRQGDGSVARIVEERDASEQVKKIHEINPGYFVFDPQVFTLTKKLTNHNAKGEYYITDLVDLYHAAGTRVEALKTADEHEVLGVNDRVMLAQAERILRDRVRAHWLREGVTMIAPEQTFIDDTVTLEPDVTLYPGVWLMGETVVERGAVIGPGAVLSGCRVCAGVRVEAHTLGRDRVIGA